MSSEHTTPPPDFHKVVEALTKITGAAQATRDALLLFAEVFERLETIEKNARKIAHSVTPLLLAQYVAQDASQALQKHKKGLALLPSQSDFEQVAVANNEVVLSDAEVSNLIGPLNDNDVLKQGDLVFVRSLASGDRLFRYLSGSMVGHRFSNTPFRIVYRKP
jgi:hypothetical protein